MLTKRELLAALPASVALAAMTRAAPAFAQAKTSPSPGFFKAKDIAEEGFVFGLPIVMNYGVMYAYCVDRNSGQYKAPVQSDQQRGERLHLQGHGDPDAQQRHALFAAVDGFARRADGDLGSGDRPQPLLFRAAL